MPNNNELAFNNFFNPECYLSIISSASIFTLLFLSTYYVFGHKLIYKYFPHIKQNEKLYWKIVDAFISTIHSTLILTLIIIFQKDKVSAIVTQEVIDSYTTKNERIIASVSIGWIIYDTISFCFIFSKKHTGKFDYMMIFHHFIMSLGMILIVIIVHSGCLMIMALFFNEITNPILNMNNIRNKLIDRNKPIPKRTYVIDFVMKLSYMISFIMARFIIMGYMLYNCIFKLNNLPILFTIYAVLGYIMCIALLHSVQKDLIKIYEKYQKSDYFVVDQCATTATEGDELSSEAENNEINIDIKYDQVLILSKRSVIQFFIAGAVYSFFHANRMSIYLLYAEEFHSTNIQIGLLLFGSHFWNGIAAILYGSLANQYGYDKMLVILLLIQCIALFLESIAMNFYMLFVGIMIGQVAITYIVMGYIAWILPEKEAKIFTSYFYSTFVATYLVAPMLAGFISFYISNRMVFVINLFLTLCALIHSLIFIIKKQRKIEAQQLQIGLVEEKDDDEQFPICLERFKNDENQTEIDETKWYELPKITCFESMMIIFILLINSTVSITETALVLYFPLYVIEEMNGNVLIGTALILIMTISFMTGNLIAPKWFDNQYKYYTVMVCLIILMFYVFYLYPVITSLNIYWILTFMVGIPLGLYSMVSEMILLEIQPKKYSGKISGAKGLLRNWIMALAMLAISLYWDINHNACFYVVGVSFGIAFILTLIMAVMKHKFTE